MKKKLEDQPYDYISKVVNEEWNKVFGGVSDESKEWGRSIQQTQDGGYIISGVSLAF